MSDNEPCPECDDTGVDDCPEMCGGDPDCEICEGDGFVECPECGW